MVIWGGSRGRTPYTYLGRYLSCRRQHGVFTEANCYPSLPPFGGHQSRSGVHYPFSTDGPRVMGGRGQTEEGEGRLLRRKWEKDAKKGPFQNVLRGTMRFFYETGGDGERAGGGSVTCRRS